MFQFSPLPHQEAVDRIAELPLVPREVMDGLLPELRAYAFTISGLDVGDQMAKVRDMIKAVPAGEKNWDKARKEIAAELADDLGGKASERRAELLLRTHVFRSYAATRYRNLMQQVDVFPFWQYRTHGDGRVRPSHAALNGKIFPAGHEIWQRIFPPWDWGCRCIVVPLTQRSADGIMARGKPSDQAAADANLLPTQIAKPEIFTAKEADIIAKNQRLPGGIPLNRTPTFSDSPWSIPGNVHHDWKLIEARYADQPEVLAAFKQWAHKQEIAPGKTVSMWIDNAQSIGAPPPKLTLKKKFQKQPAQRSLQDAEAALQALKPAYDAAQQRVDDAWAKCAKAAPDEVTAATSELNAAKARLETVKEQARAAVSLPPKERGRLDLVIQGPKPKNLKAGRDAVERFVHPDLLKPQITIKPTTGRAQADFDSSLVVGTKDSAASVAHEITHILEYSDAASLASARDFLFSRRLAGEIPVKMQTLDPGAGYWDWEIVFEDNWAARSGTAYSGKLYFPGVDVPHLHQQWLDLLKTAPDQAQAQIVGTEILTMGMERLLADPLAFHAQDADYFGAVLSTLQKLTP